MTTLPADVISIILGQFGDFESYALHVELKSWSLISRNWTTPCQALLYRTICFDLRATPTYVYLALSRVLLIAKRPHLRMLIQRVYFMWNGNENHDLPVTLLCHVLAALFPSICHIELSWNGQCPDMQAFDPLANIKSWTFSPCQLGGRGFQSWSDFLSLQLRLLTSLNSTERPYAFVERHGPVSLSRICRVHLTILRSTQAFVDCIKELGQLSCLEEVVIHALCFQDAEKMEGCMPRQQIADCRLLENTEMLWRFMPSLRYFYVRIANGGLIVPLLRTIFKGSLPRQGGFFPALQVVHVDVHHNARSPYPAPTFRPFQFCYRDYRPILTRERSPKLRQIWIHIMDRSLFIYDEEKFLNTMWDQSGEKNVVQIDTSLAHCHNTLIVV